MKKYFISNRCLAAVLCAAIAFPVGLSLGAAAQERDPTLPSLSDLMTLTQLRHYKLWYAERADNWRLANYELDQFITTVDRITKLYPGASAVAQANTIREKTYPALSELRKAINDKDSSRFEAAYKQITASCNQCHQAADVGFIVVQVPTRSPFSNQDFRPNP